MLGDTSEPPRQCDILARVADLRVEVSAGQDNCLLANGWHGHVAWEYLAGDGRWDPATEQLARFSTGREDTAEASCDACSGNEFGDVNRLDWSPVDTAFILLEQEVSGDWCPADVVVDRHDPSLTPHPGGEYKIYSKAYMDHWVLGYLPHANEAIEDTSAPHFYFEDTGLTRELGEVLPPGCVEDPSTLIWKKGTEIHEVMFFTAYSGAGCFVEHPGILAAVLRND